MNYLQIHCRHEVRRIAGTFCKKKQKYSIS